MLRPKLIGGIIIVLAVALASVFSGKFPNIGGSGDGADGETQVSVAVESSTATPTEVAPVEAGPSDVVLVLIDGSKYLLQHPDGSAGTEIDLETLIEQVQQAPGNSEGIQLSVSRSEASLPSAEKALEDALEKADIGDASVEWKEGLVASAGS